MRCGCHGASPTSSPAKNTEHIPPQPNPAGEQMSLAPAYSPLTMENPRPDLVKANRGAVQTLPVVDPPLEAAVTCHKQQACSLTRVLDGSSRGLACRSAWSQIRSINGLTILCASSLQPDLCTRLPFPFRRWRRRRVKIKIHGTAVAPIQNR